MTKHNSCLFIHNAVKPNFDDLLKMLIVGNNLDIMQQTLFLVINQVMVDNNAALIR